MADRVSNPEEVLKDAFVIPDHRRGESLFANIKLSLAATQRVFGSLLVVQHRLVGKSIMRLSI